MQQKTLSDVITDIGPQTKMLNETCSVDKSTLIK